MPPTSSQAIPILSFMGVVVQFGGALMLITLFVMLRRFVLRRGYFGAWMWAWVVLALAIGALVIRYILLPSLPDNHLFIRLLYVFYQAHKGIGFILFARGTLMYVGGSAEGIHATRRLWIFAIVFAVISAFASRNGLNEMVIWQSAIAVPALGYCASALLWLPRARRTPGSVATGTAFGLLAALWLVYASAFAMAVGAIGSPGPVGTFIVGFNTYFDLALNVILGYSMVVLLMEDNKREIDDAQAELRVTHDQLRRAALYDSLTDSLNRRAFAEGVGLEMVKATFGTVVLADLDNLKFVNDRFGHSAGDQILRRCADVLRATLRRYDKLYRWGGDEFLLIVPSAHAADVSARLRAAVDGAEAVTTAAGERIVMAVSLGAVDYASSEELAFAIEHADRAMYAEKSRRKNEMRGETGEVVYSPPTSRPAVR